MKLVRFAYRDSHPRFGLVVGDHAVAFEALRAASAKSYSCLTDSKIYLANLPASEQAARELLAWGQDHLGELAEPDRPLLAAVRLHEPVEVAALFDFGLTPRHL